MRVGVDDVIVAKARLSESERSKDQRYHNCERI